MEVNGNSFLATQPTRGRTARNVEEFKRALVDNLYYNRGQGAYTASKGDVYTALVYTVRDYLMDRWRKTIARTVAVKPRFVYYLSAEYLPGRQITQNLLYTDTMELARQALAELGYELDELVDYEPEPALGNGGLGRLAACFMDSMATLDIPSVAYGINYEFGIFTQSFRDGYQVEAPDDWLYNGNPWEYPQPENRVEVGFGGSTEYLPSTNGELHVRWHPAEKVLGEPSHMLVPGYHSKTVNLLRLWRARASKEFDFQLFDVGDYARAAESKIYSENISKVLYPNDNTPQGRELRLKQEYFFVACSLKDILRRFLAFSDNWEDFPKRTVIQLNDTHPVLAIPELMRLLMDEHGLGWKKAWELTSQVFAYTCHTLMPEALEKWPVGLFQRLLPRHMEIVNEINHRFIADVRQRFPDRPGLVGRVSIIEEGQERLVRMAYLAAVGSYSINGVAELHTELLKQQVLNDFFTIFPEKFNNKTNGVTPRRFMRLANPRLAELIASAIGDGWLNNLERLQELEPYAEDAQFRSRWQEVKQANKQDLAWMVLDTTGIAINPDMMFDVMVKRLHEYKRQLLKALHIITLYNRLKEHPKMKMQPRAFIFGAKAAPGYASAKLIIKLINSIGEVINTDPLIKDRLKVAFIPNFNVTKGEVIYPGADLSEQISLAGKEASGTGNMKFALNGAVTIGTLDGANIEIRERVGADNFFLFGLTAAEVLETKAKGYSPLTYYNANLELRQAVDSITRGIFSPKTPDLFRSLMDSLLYHDEYMLLADYAGYIAAQDKAEKAYQNAEIWTRMSILNTARSGYFSSDRSIQQYVTDIWKTGPVR
jgi:glycogen phosphorylase